MSSKTNNESRVKKYLIDLTRTLKNIEEYLKLQKECCDNLIAFVTQVELQFVEFKKQSMRNEDSIIVCAVSISQEISIIVCF